MDINSYYVAVTYIMAGIVGLCVGSFLNVVIYRAPLNMSVAKPASHCPVCKSPIKWYDNIPVVSYICLGAKCRNCKVHIPFRYTAVEIGNAVLWLLSVRCFLSYGLLDVLIAAVVSSSLICIFFIDLEKMIILDRFQIILLALAVIITVEDSFYESNAWISHLIGGAVGFGVTFIVALVGEKLAGREALGGGDIKLCGVMGLFLGWQRFILAMLIASVTASIVIIAAKLKNKNGEKEYPFAPFLSVGFLVGMFFGNSIINLYMSLLL